MRKSINRCRNYLITIIGKFSTAVYTNKYPSGMAEQSFIFIISIYTDIPGMDTSQFMNQIQ